MKLLTMDLDEITDSSLEYEDTSYFIFQQSSDAAMLENVHCLTPSE